MSSLDLHPDRLGTTDEFGRRVFPQPADVHGTYRTRRTWVQAFLIVFFLILPWIQIGGRQALLLDLVNRKFDLFGLSLRAHNAPLLVLVLLSAFFALFFVTAIWGRIWCGWACPQTVFIDGVFRRIERWVEGHALARKQLDRETWTFRKIRLRITKWSLYTACCLVLTHSFLAYFVGTKELREMVTSSPLENWTSFLFIGFTTGLLLFDFGWFREQFCVIACPYGRFQSVAMDSNSMIVAYDVDRGEPRATPQAKALAKTHGAKLGDCVNCYRCVQVCPVGIDIRRGLQMECIACTACVDACDEIMEKISKPKGLIRYDSLRGIQAKSSATNKTTKKPRFRASIYGFASVGCLIVLAVLLRFMEPVEIGLFRAKDSPYTVEIDGSEKLVNNHYKIEVSNQSEHAHSLDFEAEDPSLKLITAVKPFQVKPGEIQRPSLFIRFPVTLLKNGSGKTLVRIHDQDLSTGKTLTFEKEVSLVGPFQ